MTRHPCNLLFDLQRSMLLRGTFADLVDDIPIQGEEPNQSTKSNGCMPEDAKNKPHRRTLSSAKV